VFARVPQPGIPAAPPRTSQAIRDACFRRRAPPPRRARARWSHGLPGAPAGRSHRDFIRILRAELDHFESIIAEDRTNHLAEIEAKDAKIQEARAVAMRLHRDAVRDGYKKIAELEADLASAKDGPFHSLHEDRVCVAVRFPTPWGTRFALAFSMPIPVEVSSSEALFDPVAFAIQETVKNAERTAFAQLENKPSLGSMDPGPFASGYEVTRDESGAINKILKVVARLAA
jgi:hypothetical protein